MPVATSRDLSLELSIFMLHNRSLFPVQLYDGWLTKPKLVAVGYKKYVFCWTVIFTGFLITVFNCQNEGWELR
jgi:hypothetical protein